MEEKICCMFGGITVILFTMSFLKCSQAADVDLFSQQLQIFRGRSNNVVCEVTQNLKSYTNAQTS